MALVAQNAFLKCQIGRFKNWKNRLFAYPLVIVRKNSVDEAIAAGVQLSIIWHIQMTVLLTQYWWVAFQLVRGVVEHRLVRLVQAVRSVAVAGVHRVRLRAVGHDFVGHLARSAGSRSHVNALEAHWGSFLSAFGLSHYRHLVDSWTFCGGW